MDWLEAAAAGCPSCNLFSVTFFSINCFIIPFCRSMCCLRSDILVYKREGGRRETEVKRGGRGERERDRGRREKRGKGGICKRGGLGA